MSNYCQIAKVCASTAGAVVCTMGTLVLIGWSVDAEHIKSVVPGLVAMNPLTAICFVFAGLSLCLQSQSPVQPRYVAVARGCALFVMVASSVKMADYILHFDIGIDRVLFTADLGNNQMAPNTAVCFVLGGLSLLIIDWITPRGYWPAHASSAMLAVLAAVSLVGYGYGASAMYRVSSYIPMALNTAFAFLALALGILFSRPNRGMAKVLFDDGLGGMMARRLIPVGVLMPCLLGWLRIWGQQAGWYEMEFGAAAIVVATMVIISAAVLTIARKLNESDHARQSANQELARQTEEVRDLYDNAPCGYHSLDPDGFFIAINRTELNWLGYEREELVGKKRFSDVITADCLPHFLAKYQEFKTCGYVKDLEFELARKDGTTFPVLLNSTAIYRSDGTYHASRTTLFDATERKRIEDAMRRFNVELESRVAERTEQLQISNAELLQKNQENEMFVYSVSHDLRSPLVNLQGFGQELEVVTQTLRNEIVDHMPADAAGRATHMIDEDVRRCLHFIQTSVSRLGRIIDALLRLSRAGRVEYDIRRVDLNHIVRRVVDSLSASIHDCGATVDVRPLSAAWGDQTALEQVFANLIGNALHYLDPRRPGNIEIGAVADPSNPTDIVCYVKDNGLGIAKAYHSKMFQALRRLHPQVAAGEGIGLALVKRIVERHQGAIWFDSVENIGSTFYVRLPTPPDDTVGDVVAANSTDLTDIAHASDSTGHFVS